MHSQSNFNQITWKTLARLHAPRNAALALCVLAYAFGNVEIRRLVGRLVDCASGAGRPAYELWAIGALATLLLICAAVRPYLMERQLASIRSRIYQLAGERLLYGSLLTENVTGQVNTFSDDAAAIEQAVMRLFVRTIVNLAWFVCAVVLLFTLHWSLPLAGATCASVPVLAVRLTDGRMKKGQARYRETLEQTNDCLAYGLNGLETVKALRLEDRIAGRVRESFDALQREKRRLAAVSGLLLAPSLAAAFLTMFAVTLLAGYLTAGGELTIGSFFVALSMIDYIVSPVMGVENDVTALRAAKAAMDHLNSFLVEENGRPQPEEAEAPALPGAPEIYIRGLSWRYESKEIFRDFDACFRPGRIQFLMGPIGSGKSTLIRLMLGQLPTQEGEICLKCEGDVRCLGGPEEIRALAGIMPQQNVLFEDSVLENIRLYQEEYTGTDVRAAAKRAGLAKRIEELPEGLNTVLGENGKPLSGGERQRLILARSLLRSKRILILDEPTSALDGKHKQEIRSLLDELSRERLVVVITHDEEILRGDDRIIRLLAGPGSGKEDAGQ